MKNLFTILLTSCIFLQPLFVSATTTVAYIHTDHLGGSSVITNDHKDIIQTTDYYPFGSIRVNTKEGNFDEKRKFTGYEFDDSTGLNYAGARYQNPGEGRFTQQDSVFQSAGIQQDQQQLEAYLSDPQGFNAYAYARGNPLVLTDKQGTYFETAFDVAMLGLSIRDFRNNQSFGNALGVGADTLSVALPIPAFVGGLRHADEVGKLINKVGDATKAVQKLPDSALVVRGGGVQNQTIGKIDSAIGPSRTPGVVGFSVQCSDTCTSLNQLGELGQYLKNKELGVTTAGAIRNLGGDVIRTPGIGQHGTVVNSSGEKASSLLQNIYKNPNPRK